MVFSTEKRELAAAPSAGKGKEPAVKSALRPDAEAFVPGQQPSPKDGKSAAAAEPPSGRDKDARRAAGDAPPSTRERGERRGAVETPSDRERGERRDHDAKRTERPVATGDRDRSGEGRRGTEPRSERDEVRERDRDRDQDRDIRRSSENRDGRDPSRRGAEPGERDSRRARDGSAERERDVKRARPSQVRGDGSSWGCVNVMSTCNHTLGKQGRRRISIRIIVRNL